MSTTAQTIWDRATTMSSMNDESLVNVNQVMDYISLYERNLFLRAARLNPEYFGTTATSAVRTGPTDIWDLSITPGAVAAVTRTEIAAIVGTVSGLSVGQKVSLISIRWPDMDVAPRALLRGRKLTEYNGELHVDNSNYVSQLTVYYSPLPVKVTNIAQTLTVPDEFADLVTYPLAKILAIRDRRTDEELQFLDKDFKDMQALFDEAVMVYDYAMRRPFVQVPATPLFAPPPGVSAVPPQGGGPPPQQQGGGPR